MSCKDGYYPETRTNANKGKCMSCTAPATKCKVNTAGDAIEDTEWNGTCTSSSYALVTTVAGSSFTFGTAATKKECVTNASGDYQGVLTATVNTDGKKKMETCKSTYCHKTIYTGSGNTFTAAKTIAADGDLPTCVARSGSYANCKSAYANADGTITCNECDSTAATV